MEPHSLFKLSGVITPGEAKIGIMPGNISSGNWSGFRSGTQPMGSCQLTKIGLGQGKAIGIGGDP